MDEEDKKISEKRKENMKTYTIHKMLTADLLFYYGIKFLFLTQVKKLSAGDIVLASAFWGIFKVIFQIPVTIICQRMGNKKCLILSDIVQAFAVLLVMVSNNFQILIIANLFGAMATAGKEVAESGMLNSSIPDGENKSKILSNIEGKGLGNYYYLSAGSAILAGLLFEVNGYIPMAICVIVLLISAKIATTFNSKENIEEIKTQNKSSLKNELKNIKKTYSIYFRDLRLAFDFIFTSRRLKALMLYSAIMYGILMVMGTYEMGLLEEINLSAAATGIIYAVMQFISGIASKKQEYFHKKFRNKTLTVLGLTYTIACLIAGVISITNIPYIAVVTVILITYTIRRIDTGAYYVLIKKYLTNFTNEEVASKVYSAHGLVTGIGNTIVCAFGSLIVNYNNLKISMIIFGAIFTAIMILVVIYMKNRVGLNPTEYRKKDINYREYISLK